MMMIVSGIMFVLTMALFTSYFIVNARLSRQWNILPTKQEYLKTHPSCEYLNKVKCNHCHSRNIHNVGVERAYSYRRQHVCGSCDNALFRSESYQFPGISNIYPFAQNNEMQR
ncbi:MAG: hypothetical protein ACRC6N_09130 [Plesiomonas sp.]|uniref:hypothetical protein n=1 Tax=Plesiomonas sp. TaxID=2486279 RepID=UPI003F2D3616